MTIKETITPAVLLLVFLALHNGTAAQTQTRATDTAARSGSLRQIIAGHYVYTTNNEGRLFNGGIVATSDGVLVFDALDTDTIARAERQAIANVITQPVRYLVSSRLPSTIRSTEAAQSMPTSSRSPTTTTAPDLSTRCSAGTSHATCSGRGCRTRPIGIA